MRKSFYTWLMTERNPKSNAPKAILADLAFHESAFPKHTDDFDEVSRYLEEDRSRMVFSRPLCYNNRKTQVERFFICKNIQLKLH